MSFFNLFKKKKKKKSDDISDIVDYQSSDNIEDDEEYSTKFGEGRYGFYKDDDNVQQFVFQYENPITNYNTTLKEEFEGVTRDKIGKVSFLNSHPSPLEIFKGYSFYDPKSNPIYDPKTGLTTIDPKDEKKGKWENYEGIYQEWNKDICSNEELVSQYQMWEFYRNFHWYQKEGSSYDEVNGELWIQTMKLLRSFRDKVKEEKYNKNDKSWTDIDIGKIFRQMRLFMIGKKSNQLPNFIWNLDFRPFGYVYIICRNYVKSKGTKTTSKILFENIVMWENGTLHRDGEPQKEYTSLPIWVNWNEIGKFFLSMKTKLKKEDGGIELLKEIGQHIKSKKTFYSKLGETSDFNISTEMIEKFESLK